MPSPSLLLPILLSLPYSMSSPANATLSSGVLSASSSCAALVAPPPHALLALASVEEDLPARFVVGHSQVHVVPPEETDDALVLNVLLPGWLQRRSAGTSAQRRARRNATGSSCTTSLTIPRLAGCRKTSSVANDSPCIPSLISSARTSAPAATARAHAAHP
jgi:hypothetical protein